MSKTSKLVAATPVARKSSAAVLAKLAPVPAAVVVAKQATTPAVPETFVDQAIVEAFIAAESSVGDAAVALFYACVTHRVSPAQFGNRPDAKVRASEFNCAHAVAKILTAKGARAVIANALKGKGERRTLVLSALRSARATSAQLKGSALKGAALSKEIGKRADAAAQAQAAKQVERNKAKRSPTTPALPKAGTLEALMPVALAALLDMQKQLAAVTVPQRMLGKVSDLSRSLAETIELAGACNDA